ncbi:MAG: lipid A biosynthesis acyltransferase [Burkholderiales bacterium]
MSRVVFFLMWLIHFLPLGAQAAIGNALGSLLFWLIPERRHVTRVNLAKCFPTMDPAARERLARAHFRAFTRSFVERGLLWWAPRARIERLVRIEGLEHLKALGGAPAILFVPHFVGLDAGGTRLSIEVDAVAMFARQKDPRFTRLLARGRTRFGNQRLVSRQEGVRAAIQAMRREKRAFFYLPDLDHGPKNAIFVPFFGVPAATVPGLSRIAKLADAKVLPCVTRMLPGGGGYVLRIEPPWEDFPTEDVEADTRRMNAYIEQVALEMPEQYLWMHKRFKTRPPGESRFY